ncbi:ABC transporter dipeptide permease DppC [Afipia carboxidovorans OM5]|uniref:ABC transporter dipeptide permease DppC n=2 Tax=Afipia carboxidovorans TaxID=40137 RepID=F8BRC7_AFIC5|nr:ABC transporter dipeptide permease DppC [Afipia carboxidovorans OM4]AEI04831.1 ABC transporter dipeptide permease DppC [Afipia carboxidovorans OM5]
MDLSFKAAAASEPAGELLDAAPARPKLWRNIMHHPGLVIGLVVLASLVLLAVFAPWVSPYDPYDQSLPQRLLPPFWVDGGSTAHLLGTDHLGRDYLSRLLYGARVSLLIGFGAASIGCVIGVTLGVCAGYFGGLIDRIVSFILTCQLALPGLLLAMALVFLIGPSVGVVICVIGFLHWSYYLVVTRAATQKIRDLEYITAARVIGSSRLQIMTTEILPNLFSEIIVIFSLEVGVAVLAEAALSFLGVGIQPPTASWGLMIAEGKVSVFLRPWLVILPGIFIFLLVLAANLVGDGLRDLMSAESRR